MSGGIGNTARGAGEQFKRVAMRAVGPGIIGLALCVGALAIAPASSGRSTAVEGTLQVRHSDDFRGKRATFHYAIKTRGGRSVALRMVGSRLDARSSTTQVAGLVPGATVRVSGRVEGRRIVARRSDVRVVRAPSAKVVAAAATGTKKVAVILLNFQNDQRQPWTHDQVRQAVFTNSDSVNAYFQESSSGSLTLEGKTRVDGDVLGWYTVPANNTPCNWSSWASAARTAAAAAGDDLSGYDHHVYVWPGVSSCGWAGLAYVPGMYSFINGYLNTYVIAHELGHNLGVHHASSYSCTDSGGVRVTVGTSCSRSEYGDPFDVMGSWNIRHLHGWHKGQLGFTPTANTQTVTQEGTYSIKPAAPALSSGTVQGVRIPRLRNSNGSVRDYYYLDFRQPFGAHFDNFSPLNTAVGGVGVRIVPEWGVITQSLLLDATPTTSTFSDAMLAPNNTFYDPATGVSVKTLAVSSQEASVEVRFVQDTTAPSVPANLTAQTVGTSTVRLNWSASSDDFSVAGYRIYRNGSQVASVAGSRTSYDNWVSSRGPHTYSVRAYDNAGNVSTASNSVTITTPNQSPYGWIVASRAEVSTGEAVTFHVYAYDSDGLVTGYSWDLDDDGSFEVDSGTRNYVSRTFSNPGTYWIATRLVDNDGGVGYAYGWVTVTGTATHPNDPPDGDDGRKRKPPARDDQAPAVWIASDPNATAASVLSGLPVKVSCSEACEFKVWLTATERSRDVVRRKRGRGKRGPARSRLVVVGRSFGKLAVAGSTDLRISTIHPGRKLFRSGRLVKPRLEVLAVDRAGNRRTHSQPIKLRR
ncbi:MAG: PKD domain-containing protein [Solirubrobacterales bacterium]